MQLARQWDQLAAANPQRVADFSLRKALHFVADQHRQAAIVERKLPATVVYTSPDGTHHVGADAVSAAMAKERDPGGRTMGPPAPLPPAVAEHVAEIEAKKKLLRQHMHDDEQEIFERAQAWAESTWAKVEETYEHALRELDAQIKALLDEPEVAEHEAVLPVSAEVSA
jgi:hypothetical protein